MEERKIQLIWEFHGEAAEATAKHHAIHLKEFAEKENLQLKITGSSKQHKEHYHAYMVVKESEMRPVRDALKPHRGVIYTEE